MSKPKKSKSGELWAAIAGLALLIGLALPFAAADISSRMQKLRVEGVVSAAIILEKQRDEQRETKVKAGGGRLVSRNNITQTFRLSFDSRAGTTFTAYTAGAPLTSLGAALPYPHTLVVGPEIFAQYEVGDTILVTFLNNVVSYDKNSFQLFDTVQAQSKFGFAFWLFVAAGLSLVIGLWAGLKAWRAGKIS